MPKQPITRQKISVYEVFCQNRPVQDSAHATIRYLPRSLTQILL